MTRNDLIRDVAAELNLTIAEAKHIVTFMIGTIAKHIKLGEDVHLTDLGTFKSVKRKAYKGRNPKTGASVMVPAKMVRKFKAARSLAAA